MLITIDELISKVLWDEADELCTAEIRDKMWKKISARLQSGDADTVDQKKEDTADKD